VHGQTGAAADQEALAHPSGLRRSFKRLTEWLEIPAGVGGATDGTQAICDRRNTQPPSLANQLILFDFSPDGSGVMILREILKGKEKPATPGTRAVKGI
jgi:hypothetical protein